MIQQILFILKGYTKIIIIFGHERVLTKGVRYMLLAALIFVIMQALIKWIINFHVFEVLFFRSSITAIFCVYHLQQNNIPFLGNNKKLLLLRALCGIISITLFFNTLQRIPLGVAISLKYMAPLFTTILAAFFLKEKVRPVQWFFFLTALSGIFLLKGFDTRIDTLSLIMGIIAAFFGGLVFTLIRKLGQSEHPMVVVNYFMFFAAILSGIMMIPFWKTPTIYEGLILITIGFLGYYAQVYMTKAVQTELVSRVTPVKLIEVVYSLIIGLIWFGERYTILALLGILLILVSMFLNLIFKKL